jgi:hypothetical protein
MPKTAEPKRRKPVVKPAKSTGSETFHYLKKQYVFDITAANRLVADGRKPVKLDQDDVRFSLKKVRINKRHLPKVDTSKPGIIAIVFAPGPDGQQVKGHRLIDGHHRAAQCLKLGIPYKAFLLSEAESAEILIKSPCKPQLDRASCGPRN